MNRSQLRFSIQTNSVHVENQKWVSLQLQHSFPSSLSPIYTERRKSFCGKSRSRPMENFKCWKDKMSGEKVWAQFGIWKEVAVCKVASDRRHSLTAEAKQSQGSCQLLRATSSPLQSPPKSSSSSSNTPPPISPPNILEGPDHLTSSQPSAEVRSQPAVAAVRPSLLSLWANQAHVTTRGLYISYFLKHHQGFFPTSSKSERDPPSLIAVLFFPAHDITGQSGSIWGFRTTS